MVLYHLEAHAGVEQVRRDGVAQRVRGGASRQAGTLAVPHKTKLDLSSLEWPVPPRKERVGVEAVILSQMLNQKLPCLGEQDLLTPRATFETSDEQATALKVNVAALQKEHLSHS